MLMDFIVNITHEWKWINFSFMNKRKTWKYDWLLGHIISIEEKIDQPRKTMESFEQLPKKLERFDYPPKQVEWVDQPPKR